MSVFGSSISSSNNRITSSGWTYDTAGNTLTDANGQKYTYDGENKQVLVKNSLNVTVGEYFYDGDGKRVKKIVPATGEVTVFVYDAAGKQIAEYSTVVANSTDAKVAYLTNDHLGSPRINTDRDGNVTARHDYHPFGEEILTAQRTQGLGYDTDTVRKQFTGYERDNETELDFAQARYHNYSLGRFSSADPLQASARPNSPQSLNRYGYVLNNPLKYTDPLGLFECPPGKQCSTDVEGEYFLDENGNKEHTVPLKIESILGCEKDKSCSDNTTTSKPISGADKNLGLGWWGRVDQFNSGEGFEIHIWDKGGTERGIVSGRNGWIGKHGFGPNPTDGIPRATLNRINGLNVNELRKRNKLLPRGTGPSIRGGAYLNPGRTMFGIIGVLNLLDGVLDDLDTWKRAQEKGITIFQQMQKDRLKQGQYLFTPFGPIPNPDYGTD